MIGKCFCATRRPFEEITRANNELVAGSEQKPSVVENNNSAKIIFTWNYGPIARMNREDREANSSNKQNIFLDALRLMNGQRRRIFMAGESQIGNA